MTITSFFREQLNKVQDFVADPDTKKFADIGSKVLNVAVQIGQSNLGGPVGLAGAAVGLLNVAANQTKDAFHDQVHRAAGRRGMVPVDANGAISLLYEQGMFQDAKPLCVSDHGSLVSIDIDGKSVAIVISKDGKLLPWWSAFVTSEYSPATAAEALWKTLGNSVVLKLRDCEYGRKQLTASTIVGYDKLDYIGHNDPKRFVDRFLEYRAAGVNKAFLLVGPPGTGKTSFCFRCAQQLGGKLMVISPDLLENQDVPKQDVVEIVAAFKPSVLLLDDVDSITSDRLLLSLMEHIRHANPDTMIVSTANDPKKIIPALRRPGRLGPRIVFPSPDLEERKELIRMYSRKFGVGRGISHLADNMDHPLFSHDYVRDVCEQALVESDEELLDYIERTKADLGVPKANELGAVAPPTGSLLTRIA